MIIPQNSVQIALTSNQYIPDEGPKAIPLLLDFTAADTFTLDMESLQARGFFSMLQAVFIDMKDAVVDLELTISALGQIIHAKKQTQGYYNILVPNPIKLVFTSVGNIQIRVFLINVPIPGAVWPTV